MKKRIETLALFLTDKDAPTMEELLDYPEDSLGYHAGRYLFKNSHDAEPAATKDDLYRVLINCDASSREEIAMHYYLLGNGAVTFYNLSLMLAGIMFCPQHLLYFCRRYRDGRKALRFHDLDLFRMLQLPLDRIKDAFLIR